MHRKRFITNSIFLLGTSLLCQLVSLFILPLFIKNLGADMYGLFVISGSLIGYLGVLDFGFTAGISRSVGQAYAEKNQELLRKTVSSGLWILISIGIISSLIIYFGRFWIIDFIGIKASDRDIAEQLLTVTAAFSLLEWPMRMPGAILTATLKIKEASIIKASVEIAKSLTTLFLVLQSKNIVWVMLGGCVFTVMGCILNVIFIRKKIPEVSWNLCAFSGKTLKAMSGFSLGIFYTQLLSMLSIQVDQLVIAGMIGVGMIPGYVIAGKLFTVVRSYTGSLFGALLPTIYSLDNERDRHKIQTVLNDGVRYRAILISPLAYLGIIISPSFISVWMGGGYIQYAIWSQLFMVVHLISIFGYALNIARGLGKLRAANILLTLRVAVNLAVSMALIPHFGIGGPILGTVVASTVLGDIVLFPWFCKMCKLEWKLAYATGLKILIANIPLVGALIWLSYQINLSTWLTVIVYAIFCCGLLYMALVIMFVGQKEKRDVYTACESLGITKIPVFSVVLRKLLATTSL